MVRVTDCLQNDLKCVGGDVKPHDQNNDESSIDCIVVVQTIVGYCVQLFIDQCLW